MSVIQQPCAIQIYILDTDINNAAIHKTYTHKHAHKLKTVKANSQRALQKKINNEVAT